MEDLLSRVNAGSDIAYFLSFLSLNRNMMPFFFLLSFEVVNEMTDVERKDLY